MIINNYEDMKDRLIIKPLYRHSERFRRRFKADPFVFRNFGQDAALAVYYIISDDNDGLITTALPYETVAQWNMDTDTVIDQALQNTANLYPAMLFRDLFNTDDSLAIDPTKPDYTSRLKHNTVPLVTTKKRNNGAVAIMFPGVKEGIAEMFGDSYYVAFTSKNEALIHKRGEIDPESIKRNVRETNNIFDPQDTFTNCVWYYDKDTGIFSEVE